MKKILLSLSVLAVVAMFGACKKSSGPSTSASVMFVNGCAETSNISISANSNAVSNAQSLAFLSTSGYQNVTAGSSVPVSFNITASGSASSAPLTNGTINITAGNDYSVFAAGVITSPVFFYTMDDLSAPASGDAKVRLVNLSNDNISLTGTATASSGTTTFGSGVSKATVSSFTSMPAGTYKIVVDDTTNVSATVFSIAAQAFASGKIYTIIYTGTALGSGTYGYTATVINNN